MSIAASMVEDHQGGQDAAVCSAFSRWWTVIVLALFGAVSLIDRSIILVLVPEIKADLGISDSQFSLMQGVGFSVAYTGFALVSGMLVDRFPRRWLMFGSMALWSAAATACGLASSYAQLVAARMVVGVGESTIAPAAQSIISDIFPRRGITSAISIFIGTTVLSAGLAIALGGWLLDRLTAAPMEWAGDMAPWRQVLIVTGLPGLVLALLIFTVPEPPRRMRDAEGTSVSWRAYGAFLLNHRRLFFGLLLGYSLTGMAAYAALSWAPTYARRVLGLTPTKVGEVMGLVVGVGGVLSTFGFGFLVDWQMRRGVEDFAIKLLIFMTILALPLGLIGFTSGSIPLFYIGLAALQCGVSGCVGPILAALQMVSHPQMRGRTAALALICSSLVSLAAGNLAVGLLTDHFFGDPMSVGRSIAIAVGLASPVGVLLLLWARKPYLARMHETL